MKVAWRAAKDNRLKKAKLRGLKRNLPYDLEDLEWEADQKLSGDKRKQAQHWLDVMGKCLGDIEK